MCTFQLNLALSYLTYSIRRCMQHRIDYLYPCMYLEIFLWKCTKACSDNGCRWENVWQLGLCSSKGSGLVVIL